MDAAQRAAALRRGHPLIVHAPDSPMVGVLETARRAARSDANILITGESGSGKELVVRTIHDLSARRKGPFVALNCGAIPENLLESELFGHVRGAFTGADRPRKGRLEQASGGTLFLDEIGDMPPQLQVKLLRVLQEREFEPVGSNERRKADFRLVAATHRSLEDAVVQGEFRQDLFFRLDVIRIHIPPLRQRPMDIPLLAEHFLRVYRERCASRVTGFTAAAMAVLERHGWPGNVRELENVIQAIVVLKDEGVIQAEDVSARLRGRIQPPRDEPAGAPGLAFDLPPEGINLREALDRLEQHLIRQALRRANGNKSRAAALLGLNRTTLVEKLKRRPITV